MLKEMLAWAQAKPEYVYARNENADGVRAAERNNAPPSFIPSARIISYTGTLDEPGQDGKRQRKPSLEVDAAAQARATRAGMPIPRVEDALDDPRVEWRKDGSMWTGRAHSFYYLQITGPVTCDHHVIVICARNTITRARNTITCARNTIITPLRAHVTPLHAHVTPLMRT